MTVSTRLGLALLPAALALGILGDWLLRCTPWGVSVLLWVLAGLVGLFVLARRLGIVALGEGMWLAVPALLLSAGLAWRDSATLRALDLCGLLVCLALGAARTRSGRVRLAGILDYVVDGLHIAFQAAFGVFTLVFRDVEWGTIPRTGWLPHVLSVVRGLVLTLPLLLFGGLLMAADAVSVLTDALPALPLAVRGTLAVYLPPAWSRDAGDWRSWSLARDQAFRAVQSRRADLLADQKFAPPGANCR